MLKQLIAPVTELLEKVIPDTDERNRLAHEIATMSERHVQEIAKAQLDVNKVEAGSDSLFRGGWRPAVGWICVCGFAVNFLISPIASGLGWDIPQSDTSVMLPVLMGMLGLGGLRTFEKTKGVSK